MIDHSAAGLALGRARAHLAPGMALAQKLAGRGAIEVSGCGSWITLSDGRRLLDFGSYGVSLFGHRHPRVVAAVHDQLDRLPASTRMLANATAPALAARLVAMAGPSRLERAWFGLNGADVVEAALKLARLATGRRRVVALTHAYHGKSAGALAATWSPRYRRPLVVGSGDVTHLDVDDTGDVGGVARECRRGDVAAVLVEPVQGEGGVRPIDPDRLRRWAEDARSAGALVLVDEVQTGTGRCGPFSIAVHEHLDPDGVLLGKALGGGVMPLSALVASAELFAPLAEDPFLHTSTFSGHPLSCAAGLAALDVFEELAGRVPVLEARLACGLEALRAAYPGLVRGVRGRGLLWGLDTTSAEVAGTLLMEVTEAGLVVSPCLDTPTVVRLLPPMTASDAEIDTAIAMLERACAATTEELR